MKRLVALVCVLISVSVTIEALEMQLISNIMNVPMDELGECLQNNNLSAEDIEDLENMFNEDNAFIKEYSPDFGCFVSCVFEKSNIMQNNEIQFDALMQLAKRNKFPMSQATRGKIGECIYEAEQEDDKCKIGLIFTSCLIRKLRQ